MTVRQFAAALVTAIIGMSVSTTSLAGQADSACAASEACAEVTSFTATVTDFRESLNGASRLVSATVRFQNTTDHALALGYVAGSGLVIDDHGNRYRVNGTSGVRGIGEVAGTTFDPKFTLQSGEQGDARLEFVWQPGADDIYGTSYDIELAIREITPVTADQYKLGREYALQFGGFGEPPSGVTAAPAPPADPCADAPRCYYAGAFAAQVTRITRSVQAPYNDQIMEVTVQFSNLTAEPLILGYTSGSSSMVDDVGNRYYWGRAGTHDQSARGIGLVTARSADPSFALAPGQSGNATFKLWFRAGRKQVGTRYTFDVTVEQLEVLPSQQIRSLREYPVGFQDLSVGAWSTTGAVESLVGGVLNSMGVTKP